ncbi:7080_t:CDS:10 [Diversispora eburnea]|uniref:7080_t:CDS:1 n=1 Tax=Diversispora eburnea TaxID=1213867 RepID=A0A9N8UZ07_9GLOM|nr:7080_t:CDS:10 [Diversispora eburnea]
MSQQNTEKRISLHSVHSETILSTIDEETYIKVNDNIQKNSYKIRLESTKNSRLAIKKIWNSEFIEAEEILKKHKEGIPRWNVTYAELKLIKQLMTGQPVENNESPELTNALAEAEKLANKVVENKDEFVKDETTLRTNYRWDCELALADILLFRSVLQLIGGSEIKGAFNLRRAWKTYCKVRDEITQIKVDTANNDSSRRSSITSIVGFGSKETSNGLQSIDIDLDIKDCLEFGLGLFNFIVSIVPSSFFSVMRTFGFNADREQAIRMLENCSGIRVPFASLLLLENYLFLPHGLADSTPSLSRAGEIVEDCVAKYPNSSPFLFMASQQARKTGKIREAINYIMTSINSCENVGVTSTNHRFEMGMTYLINLDFSTAKDIFELLFYGNTIVFTGKKGSIRLKGSTHGSTRFLSKKNTTKKDKSFLQLFEFELRPFCGLCLAGTSASGIVRFGTGGGDKKEQKTNRYNKFASRHSAKDVRKNDVSPFLLFVILYFRRDLFYMPLELKKRWSEMLETTWEKIKKPTDPDTNAIYLLLRGFFEKFLNSDPVEAQTSFIDCLALEAGVINDTWVIPHCRYEFGELLYKQFGNEEAAMEQFNWILKGQRPLSRTSGLISSRRESNSSITSLTADLSSNNNPERFKKYEFSRSLKNRCTAAVDQIRNVQEQNLQRQLSEQKIQSINTTNNNDNFKNNDNKTENNNNPYQNNEGFGISQFKFKKRHKPRSLSLPQNEIEIKKENVINSNNNESNNENNSKENNSNNESKNNGNKSNNKGLKKLVGFKFRK